MKKRKKAKRFNSSIIFMSIFVLLCATLIGCATAKKKDVVNADVEEQVKSDVEVKVKKPKTIKYIVVKGDCLWDIAAKKEIYNDPYLWWSIYKDNRDIIGENPDVIEINQELTIKKVLKKKEKEEFRQKAYSYGEK